jgi:hypothetical protein
MFLRPVRWWKGLTFDQKISVARLFLTALSLIR